MTPRSLRVRDNALTAAVISVFLAAVVWIGFGQVLGHEFVSYDDGDYVYANSMVVRGLTPDGIQSAFTHFHAANWHPLTTISHMLDCQLYGLQPRGHHLTNLLLHAAASILLFLALRKLTGILWPSACAAALFAIHPLRVESVAWVAERKDVLSGVFFMLTLLAYARYAFGAKRSRGRYLMVVAFFALGLLCKPTLVTLPFVLLLLDYWPLARFTRIEWSLVRDPILEKVPLFALSAASCVVTLLAQKEALQANLNLSLAERAGNAAVAYTAYLVQMIYPSRLTVLYPYHDLKSTEIVAAALLLVGLSAVFFVCRRRYPFLLIGWLWFVGMLVPMIGLVQVGNQPRADRYTYLPQIGLCIAITWGAMELFGKLRRGQLLAGATAMVVILALAVRTRGQTSYWRSSEALWEHAISSTSDNYVAHDNLGTVLLRKRQINAALEQFQEALRIKPDLEDACASAGSALMLAGQTDQAINYFQRALRINPGAAEEWSNLGSAFLQEGRLEEAISDYRKAASLKPQSAELQYNLGRALALHSDWTDALASYQEAMRISPNDAKIRNNLAIALVALGRVDEALGQFNEALRIDGNYADAHYNLGHVLVQQGRREEAVPHLITALRLKPDYPNAKQELRDLGISSP